MGKNVRTQIYLQGLGCANCASKIEQRAKNIAGAENVSMNFVSKTLNFETKDEKQVDEIVQEIKKIVKSIEPDVKVSIKEETEDKKTQDIEYDKLDLLKIIVASVLFVMPMIFKIDGKAEIAIYVVSYIIAGGEVLLNAGKNILKAQIFDENFLMSVATIGAFAVKQFPEGVAVMLFYQIGEFIQDIAVNHSRKSITDLMDVRPDYANIYIGKEINKVSPKDVKIGNIILIKPGEKVPLDGKVVKGESLVDTSALTGEFVPRQVEQGSDVLCGFINTSGLLTVEVTKEYGESAIAKILDMVENASSRKAPTENFITKFAKYYTPAVVAVAAFLAVALPLITGESFSQWIYRALIFLVVSCPCALVISIPLGFFGGIGAASKKGILVKGSNYLEALNNVDTVVFDKTGTLTKGVFEVVKVSPFNDFTKEELLEYAAYSEEFSIHPIGKSIVKAYGKEIDREKIKDYTEISGNGIKVNINGKNVLAGNEKYMKRENISVSNTSEIGTIVHVALDNDYAGYIVISDEIKQDAKEAVKNLKEIGIRKTVMLTGDNKIIGEKVADEIGIDEFMGELLPDQKVQAVEKLCESKKNKSSVLFVGDGINDAPVLARADVGIAMGGLGSDAAIEAADIVIVTDEPSKIVTAIKIARNTRKIVWQNIVFALTVKAVVLILAALGFATIWEAVFADVGVTVIAVINSMRTMKN